MHGVDGRTGVEEDGPDAQEHAGQQRLQPRALVRGKGVEDLAAGLVAGWVGWSIESLCDGSGRQVPAG